MTTKEAKAILDSSPFKNGAGQSKMNKFLTQSEAHKIVNDWIVTFPDDYVLDSLQVKRVLQVSKNKARP